MGDYRYIATLFFLFTFLVIVTTFASDTELNTNPIAGVEPPVEAEDFSVMQLWNEAPRIPLVEPPKDPDFGSGSEEYCWIEWFCPPLPTDEIARSIHVVGTSIVNIGITLINVLVAVFFVIIMFIYNIFNLFNLTNWSVFNTHPLLFVLALMMTIVLGAAQIIFIIKLVTGSAPWVGGVK